MGTFVFLCVFLESAPNNENYHHQQQKTQKTKTLFWASGPWQVIACILSSLSMLNADCPGSTGPPVTCQKLYAPTKMPKQNSTIVTPGIGMQHSKVMLAPPVACVRRRRRHARCVCVCACLECSGFAAAAAAAAAARTLSVHKRAVGGSHTHTHKKIQTRVFGFLVCVFFDPRKRAGPVRERERAYPHTGLSYAFIVSIQGGHTSGYCTGVQAGEARCPSRCDRMRDRRRCGNLSTLDPPPPHTPTTSTHTANSSRYYPLET